MKPSRAAPARALAWALVTWALCGLVMTVGRAVLGLEAALLVHLAAAPLLAFGATRLYWRHPGHLGAGATAALFLAVVVGLDLFLVAPFFERSYAMFRSVIGTWLPFALIFGGSLAAGATARPRTRGEPG